MLGNFSTKLALPLLLLLVAACAAEEAPKPVRARIVAASATGYELQTVTFTTLRDLKTLDGDFMRFYGNAKLNAAATDVMIVEDPSKVYLNTGKAVALDYTLADGVVVPSNFDSMAMLTAFYHFERIVEFWRDQMGLDLADYGKFRVFYDPDMVAENDEFSASIKAKVNAAFILGPRDFLLFKTSRLELLPLKMNRAVLAHEFGHGVFDYYFAEQDVKVYGQGSADSTYVLNGMNEGVADFFAWMVTQRTDEMVASLEVMREERVVPVSWTSKDLASGGREGACTPSFYRWGSLLASALYEITNETQLGPQAIGEGVVKALGDMRTDWLALRAEKAGFQFHHLIKALVARAPTDQREVYCKTFRRWFDDEVNQEGMDSFCSADN